ncbi:MAG: hypothetical protein HYV33_00605 [Candidatus Kerfeldbacteria bacterium]|nr:hypothetical protein [Candidatus Kerfeldbacteria bacterium]
MITTRRYVLMTLWLVVLPTVTLAAPHRTLQPKPNFNKPLVSPQRNNTNQSILPNKLNVRKPERPQTLNDGINQHEQIIQQRIQRLQNFNRIPEAKRAEVLADFETELAWLQTMRERLTAANSEADAQSIRQEIIEHVRTKREQRQQLITEQITLPTYQSNDRAEQIIGHFNVIIQHLDDAGVDISELQTTLADYQLASQQLKQQQDALLQDKTIDHLRAVRDQLQTVQGLGQQLRNQIQSIVMQLKSSKS